MNSRRIHSNSKTATEQPYHVEGHGHGVLVVHEWYTRQVAWDLVKELRHAAPGEYHTIKVRKGGVVVYVEHYIGGGWQVADAQAVAS